MTIEAQNAFLKLLEEPPADTVIILTASPDKAMLPTIASRLQRLKINTPSKNDLVNHFVALGKPSMAIERAYSISSGQVGLMSAILHDNTDHPLMSAIEMAKKVMSQTIFERLALVDTLAKQKASVPDLLFALERLYGIILGQAAAKGNGPTIKKAHHALVLLLQAEERLSHNPNTKLLLTDLFLNI